MKTGSGKVSMEAQLVGIHPMQPFRPLAYYDKHLDCIRIQIKDCSFTEVRVNKILALWYENHTPQAKAVVGFTIKGVKHLFVTLGLPKSGPVMVARILDEILQQYPEQTIKQAIQDIRCAFKNKLDLTVSELPQDLLAA